MNQLNNILLFAGKYKGVSERFSTNESTIWKNVNIHMVKKNNVQYILYGDGVSVFRNECFNFTIIGNIDILNSENSDLIKIYSNENDFSVIQYKIKCVYEPDPTILLESEISHGVLKKKQNKCCIM
jgi:hypothetical protein